MNAFTTRTLLGLVAAGGIAGAVAVGAPVAHADFLFNVCPSGTSGVATGVTSCPFADDARYAWQRQVGNEIAVYSPVTGQTYDMSCDPTYTTRLSTGRSVIAVRCDGGVNAVVVFW